MTNEIAPPSAPTEVPEKQLPNNKVKTYQWTPEQVQEYFSTKYPDLKKPEGKKPAGAWQSKNKPKEAQ